VLEAGKFLGRHPAGGHSLLVALCSGAHGIDVGFQPPLLGDQVGQRGFGVDDLGTDGGRPLLATLDGGQLGQGQAAVRELVQCGVRRLKVQQPQLGEGVSDHVGGRLPVVRIGSVAPVCQPPGGRCSQGVGFTVRAGSMDR
jgi:hypothetical protein